MVLIKLRLSSNDAIETTVVDVPKSIPTKVLLRINAEFLTAGKNDEVVILFILVFGCTLCKRATVLSIY